MTTSSDDASRATIRPIAASEAEARLEELGGILVDAVANGASVNFLAGFTQAEARRFWEGQMPTVAAGQRRLIVGEGSGRLLGTVILTFAPQPNGQHRAEIGKMLVLSSARRHGLGRRLLAAAEAEALAAGRTLLVLDTETGSAGDRLYRRCGWVPVGGIPGFALTTDGRPAEATIFYKRLV